MRIAYYLNCVSAHEIPVVLEVVKLIGYENVVYIDGGFGGQSYQTIDVRKDMGVKFLKIDSLEAREAIETWDVMITGIRDLGLFKRRQSRGLVTFYGSERWFKPIPLRGIKVEGWRLKVGEWNLPGWVKMLVPSYRRMVKKYVDWLNGDPNAYYLAEGPWAKNDFLRLGVNLDKIIDWGYFVEPSISRVERGEHVGKSLRVLWAGRDIPLKHVKDIEKAVELANKRLDKGWIRVWGVGGRRIEFTKLTGVAPEYVRKAMRDHDTFVFASNAYEGWGAVVSEALEEGMNVIGTYECGSCPAMLPKERLYHCGDVKELARLLTLEAEGLRLKAEGRNPILPECSIGEWTAKNAARRLVDIAKKWYNAN